MAAKGVGALSIAVVLLTGCLPAAAARTNASPKEKMLVIANGKIAKATRGNSCLTTAIPPFGFARKCKDVIYDPTPRKIFQVSAGSTIIMCVGAPATAMSVNVLRDTRDGPRLLASPRARRLDKTGECWRSRLPKRIASATSLDFLVRYGDDYAGFTAGFSVRR